MPNTVEGYRVEVRWNQDLGRWDVFITDERLARPKRILAQIEFHAIAEDGIGFSDPSVSVVSCLEKEVFGVLAEIVNQYSAEKRKLPRGMVM